MKVNMKAAADCSVDIKTKSFTINQEVVNGENFLNQLNLEVIQRPKKAKQLKASIIATQMALISTLVQSKALASPKISSEILPPELLDGLWTAIVVITVLGVLAAWIGLMIAGVYKMFSGKEKADTWTVNILKGLGQVLGAPIIIALIVGTYILLFGNIPLFAPIKVGVDVFLNH